MNQIIQWSKGNPGALTFLMSMMQPNNMIFALTIIQKLEEAESIRGTNLYVLWSDLCGRDMSKVELSDRPRTTKDKEYTIFKKTEYEDSIEYWFYNDRDQPACIYPDEIIQCN